MATTDPTSEIFQKRRAKARRSEIAKNAKQSLKDYQAGKLVAVTADEIIKKLSAL